MITTDHVRRTAVLIIAGLVVVGAVIGTALAVSPADAAPSRQGDAPVTVRARRDWQRAGVRLAAGQTVEIVYVAGGWTTWRGVVAPHDAAGDPHLAGPTEPLPGAPKGALVGRIGDAAPFLVGAGGTTVAATADGPLQLGMNDAPLARHDNAGAVELSVTGGGQTVEVVVDAAAEWVPAGLEAAAGMPLTFGAASGGWTFWEPVLAPHSAAGALFPAGPAEALPGAPKGGLVARVGRGRTVYIGNKGVLTADVDGPLQLRINDADGVDLRDNAGAIQVTVTRID